VKDDRLALNPCVGVELPRLTGRKEGHIGAAQLAALAKASGSYRPMILLLGYSGMRWGEAVALRVRSIDFLAGKITVSESMAEVGGALHFGTTKTGRNRTPGFRGPSWTSSRTGWPGRGPTTSCSLGPMAARCGTPTSGRGCGYPPSGLLGCQPTCESTISGTHARPC
jgi:hypothetical protein